MTLSQLISASTAFIGELFNSLWDLFQQYLPAVLLLGFVLHFLPDTWEQWGTKKVTALPLLGKAVLLVALIYVVIQIKSADVQPFIYFQF